MKGLKKWRERKGYSQKEVAISLGVAAPQISKWEAEVTNPTLENVIKLADLYEVTLDEIAGRPQASGAVTSEEISLLQAFRQLTPEARSVLMATATALLQQPGMRQETPAPSAM